ncbi:hypothetical protein [Actinacidiphila rubida]|uniref:hypothetical protein n=1 Tax=Actinacidiphila rubida TaxID=310780 RepID=UPI000849C15F|nr:hypothetical protein [Actinacidiphila rubida]
MPEPGETGLAAEARWRPIEGEVEDVSLGSIERHGGPWTVEGVPARDEDRVYKRYYAASLTKDPEDRPNSTRQIRA